MGYNYFYMKNKKTLITIFSIIFISFFAYLLYRTSVVDKVEISPTGFMEVRIPMFNRDDALVFESHEFIYSPDILEASYKALFEENAVLDSSYNGLYFDSVFLRGGTAQLNLTGVWRPLGDLSGFYFKELVEATAFQFDDVALLMVYVDGKPFDWCIDDQSDGEGGCPEQARPWMTLRQ